MTYEDFTGRHEEELAHFFAGAFAGDMGLRSWMANYLENAAAAARSEYTVARTDEHGFPAEAMKCRPSRSGASEDSSEIGAASLHAVRAERRVRAALSGIHEVHRKALALRYVPLPRSAPDGLADLGELRAVVAYLAGHHEARDLVRTASAPASSGTKEERERIRQERTRARGELSQHVARARALVSGAQAAYAAAAVVAARAEREDRIRRFAQGLE